MADVTSNDQLADLAIEGPWLDRDLDRQNVVFRDLRGRFIIEFHLEESFAFVTFSDDFDHAKFLGDFLRVS